MATIHLVRHAQGYHNLSLENQKISDPDLTPFGENQCRTLCNAFDGHDKITHLVASPMRRTMYTCLLSFAPVAERGVKVVALPEAQEISTWPCDIGSEPEKIKAEFGSKVDFSLVQKGWNDKSPSSKFEPLPEKLVARSREVRVWLQKLAREAGENAEIVLVTHGGILHFITEDWDEIKPGKGTGWENTEHRSYKFVDLNDTNASLKETAPSRRQRRGSAIPLTHAEQEQLRQAFSQELKEEYDRLSSEDEEENPKHKS